MLIQHISYRRSSLSQRLESNGNVSNGKIDTKWLKPILAQCSISIPSENVRKPLVSGGIENELKWVNDNNISLGSYNKVILPA